MDYLKKVVGFFSLYLIILLLPFNGFPYGKSIFGELYVELSYYPAYLVIIFVFFMLIKKKKIYFFEDKLINYFLLFFFLSTIISFILNYNNIIVSNLKGRSGIEKFIFQELVIIFGIVFSYSFYNFLVFLNIRATEVFSIIKKTVFFTFLLAFTWGFFEFLYKFTFYGFNFIHNIDCLVSINCNDYHDRLKFFSGEPSWFGIYLVFSLPFFISYINDFKSVFLRYFFILIFLFFAYFTFSRTVYMVIIFQFFIFFIFHIYFILKERRAFGNLMKYSVVVVLSSLLLIFPLFPKFFSRIGKIIKIDYLQGKSFIGSFSENSYAKQSNTTRKNMQLAGIKMWLDNPILGVGLGQYGFHVKKYLNSDFFEKTSKRYNPEIDDYFNKTNIWPASHGLLSRMLAELGVIGSFLWISIWIYLLYKLVISLKSGFYIEEKIILIIIIASLQLLNFSSDSFRFLGYWLEISLILFLSYKEKYVK